MFSLPNGAEAVERIEILAMPSIPCAALHLGRYAWAASKILADNEHLPTVLDIACGTGYGSNLLASIPAEVIGVDLDLHAIETAKKNHTNIEDRNGRVSYVNSSWQDFFSSNSTLFDYIVCFETLEHVENLPLFLTTLLQFYSTKLFLSVPHNEPERSWPFHKTFNITKQKLEVWIGNQNHSISFYAQDGQPGCQISNYSENANNLLLEVVKR